MRIQPVTIGQPAIRPVAYGSHGWPHQVRLAEPYRLAFIRRRVLYVLNCCAGWQYDGGSIPHVARSSFGPYDADGLPGYTFHDAAYEGELTTRGVADDCLWFLCRLGGMSTLRADIVWDAVRVGGGPVWARHTPGSIEVARAFVALICEPTQSADGWAA